MTHNPPRYVGRYAPSPTGPLHFGSLVAAVGSYLEARAHGGRWLLRIEDVDAPRTVPGASDGILHTLARFGFEWDGSVVWQSARQEAYQAAFEQLRDAGHLFPCACTRRELADSALARDGSRIYPGTCRGSLLHERPARAWRVRVAGAVDVIDRIQGPLHEQLEREVGDFVILRADGLFAYQLAVVVDDAEAGVTDVVRGADLLGSTARQVYLQRLLEYPTPGYAHLPVAVNAAGEKLSKQTLAAAIDAQPPGTALMQALGFLGHPVPGALAGAPLAELWAWALANWRLEAVPRTTQALAPDYQAIG